MSQTVILVLLLLACPVGMCLMMWFMNRYQRENVARNQPQRPAGFSSDADVVSAEATRLRAEIDQLKAAQRDSPPAPPQTHGPRPPGI